MFYLAIWLAKTARVVTRLTGRGQGTSFPGLLAQKIDKKILKRFSEQLAREVIVIAGTNGKTTTSQIVNNILKQAHPIAIANTSSANLSSGITTTFITAANWLGKLPSAPVILEVDEQVLSKITSIIRPTHLILTNLFRDQLDRYGEIDTIAKNWREAIRNLTATTTLVVNGNDPRLIDLAGDGKGATIYFGTQKPKILGESNLSAADTTRCPACRGQLEGSRFMAHLGVLNCQQCNMRTPEIDTRIEKYLLTPDFKIKLEIKTSLNSYQFDTQLFGRFNSFNIAAAVAVAESLSISKDKIIAGVNSTQPVFGRSESINIGGQKVFLHLAKNPTGYNEILVSLNQAARPLSLLLILNDNWADGQDISWIWDVDFEMAVPRMQSLIVSGQRAGDLAVRLAIAGFKENIVHEEKLDQAFKLLTEKKIGENDLHIIASYTGMIFLRKILAHKGLVKKQW